MNDRDRLGQLRDLLDRLERTPASADRDWMLTEIRRRVVDVEAGMPASPLRVRPQDEWEAALAAERAAPAEPAPPRKRRRRERPRRAPVAHLASPLPPAPARERCRDEVVDLLEQGGLLWLDDSPAVTNGASRPWSGGLRA